jgi:hypothetical protein
MILKNERKKLKPNKEKRGKKKKKSMFSQVLRRDRWLQLPLLFLATQSAREVLDATEWTVHGDDPGTTMDCLGPCMACATKPTH